MSNDTIHTTGNNNRNQYNKEAKVMLEYNLQFFAEEEENNDDTTTSDITGSNESGLDPEAFAEIISEKDKKLEELEGEIKNLKKTNAEMLLRINSAKPDTFDFDKAVMSLDTRAQAK